MTGVVAQTASQAAIMLVLAHVTSAPVVGQYALGLAIAAPLNTFVDRSFRLLQCTATDQDFPLSDYLAVRTLVGSVGIAVTMVAVVYWHMSESTASVVMLVALTRFVEGIAQTLYGRLHRSLWMKAIGQSQVARSALSTLASLGCLIRWHRLDVALVVGLVAHVAVIIAVDSRNVRALDSHGNSSHRASSSMRIRFGCVRWVRLIAFASPLAAATWLISLSTNLPRLLLAHSSSESILGIFAILCYASVPGTMLVSAIMQAATPRLASLYRDGRRHLYEQLLRKLTLIAAVIGITSWFVIHTFGPVLLRRALGEEYASWPRELDWITAASCLGYLTAVPATALSARRLFRHTLLTCSVSCMVALIASILLIPRHLMMGAAVAMLLTNSVHGLLSLAMLRYLDSSREPVGRPQLATARGGRAA